MKRIVMFCAALAALWAVAGQAQAGVLIEVTETGGSGGTAYAYSSSNTGIFAGTVGDYQVNVDVSTTNYPGTTSGGTLNTTTSTQAVGPATGTLTVLAAVATTLAPDTTFTPGPGPAASLLTFSLPSASALKLQSQISSSGNSAGSVTFTSTSNGVTTAPLTIGIPDLVASQDSAAVVGPGYTLYNTTVLHLNPGDVSIGTTGHSLVTPEPSSIVLLGFGAIGVCGYGLKRRKLAA